MKHPTFKCFLLTLLLPLGVLLSGCDTALKMPGMSARDPLKARAERYAADKDYRRAAQVYLDSARGLPPAEAALKQLGAAEYLSRGNRWTDTHLLLNRINSQLLTPDGHDRFSLLKARVYLADALPIAALQQLQNVKQPEQLPDNGIRYYQLKAAANQMSGNTAEALKQLVWLDGLFTDRNARRTNQSNIWQQLSILPDTELQALRLSNTGDALSGWVDLAYQVRANRYTTAGVRPAIEAWRDRYPGHPAEQALVPELLRQAPESYTMTGKIAVLLPLTGQTANQAAAIRDGIRVAHEQGSSGENKIMFYDTSTGTETVWQVYQRAVAEGANFVIGPLLKDNISELVVSGNLQVPVLALNQVDTDIGFSLPLYQFGLNPEDEARQIAERARQDGHQRIVALVPESAWGERVLSAFASQWQLSGGQLMGVERYPAKTTDFTQYIKRLLNLDTSSQRHRALVRRLGLKIEFEPRRRQDVDSIFIVAFPREARQIRPQFQFHRASDLPIYATSHVYSGVPRPEKDRDLNNVRFCDTPWTLGDTGDSAILRVRIESIWQSRASHYQRLFALGIDAYRVIPWLETLGRQDTTGFNGMTGVLSMDEHRRLERHLDCAEFKRGLPQRLGTLPDMTTEDFMQSPGTSIRWSTRP